MNLAYCILSHRDPTQVARLAKRIQQLSPDSQVIIHHDPRSEALPSEASRLALPDARPAEWGRWSLVEASLRLFDEARRRGSDAAVLISGQDYPIRPLRDWESKLFTDRTRAIMRFHEIDPLVRGRQPPADDRYLRAWLRWYDVPRPGRSTRPTKWAAQFQVLRGKLLNRVQPTISYRILPNGHGVIGVRRRNTPFDDGRMRCFWGSQWMALHREAIDVALNAPSELTTLFRSSLIPDESYVHTVLINAGVPVQNSDITVNEWTGSMGEAHPQIVDLEVLRRARSTGLPFARKFDPVSSAEALDEADRLVDEDRAFT